MTAGLARLHTSVSIMIAVMIIRVATVTVTMPTADAGDSESESARTVAQWHSAAAAAELTVTVTVTAGPGQWRRLGESQENAGADRASASGEPDPAAGTRRCKADIMSASSVAMGRGPSPQASRGVGPIVSVSGHALLGFAADDPASDPMALADQTGLA